jgi:hypothetical protein
MRQACLAMLLLAGLLAGGCGQGKGQLRYTGYEQYADEGGPRAYRRAVRRWTQELRLYNKWETSLLMRATFKAPRFRRAYSHEYARRYILPQDDYALLLQRELEDASRYHEIVFAVWADDTRRGDFVGKDAPWKVRLVGDGGRTVDPLILKRIRRPTTELLSLFPYITPHDRVFVAKFPTLGPDGLPLITEQTPVIKMQVAGVVHRGELIWDLHGP